LVIVASLAGCSHLPPRSSGAAPAGQPVASPAPPGNTSVSPSPSTEPGLDAKAPASVVAPAPTTPPSRSEPAPASRSAADRTVPPATPVPGAPGRPSTATAAIVARPAVTPAPKPGSASNAPDKPPPPPSLDLAALEQRLRDTHAVGLFTKLSLKNQVDDLLGQFRAYYRDHRTVPPSELRQRYDGLLLKVLSVLQDGDPPLAAQIWSSREAIWGVLADPAKFERI
jgi:hypothetical protein